MKKTIAFLLTMLLTFALSTATFADSVPMNKEDQMVNMVRNYLDAKEYSYEYDDYVFTTQFSLNCAMEYAYTTIYVYDDMLAVSVDAPVLGSADVFEKIAIFTTLANNELYYAQFRVDRDDDNIYVSCRSCNLVEDAIPGENELYYLIGEPLVYMSEYGDGVIAVINGGDPYEAFEACQEAVDAQ